MTMKNMSRSISVVLLYFIWSYGSSYLFNDNLSLCLVANFILLSIIIFLFSKKLRENLCDLKVNFKSYFKKTIFSFLIGVGLYVIFNFGINELLSGFANDQEMMINMFNNVPVLFIVSTLFYYPVIEELVFKLSFKEFITNKWLFVIFTGFINAFFQIVFSGTSYLYLIAYSIFYMMLSYIYFETDNIILSVMYRVFYNLIPSIAALLYIMMIIG